MYTRSFQNDKSKKFSFKSSRFGGRNRFNRSTGGHNKFSSGEKIDPAKFINKAITDEEVDIFKPEHEFRDFKIDQRLKQIVMARGYKTPTPIQDKVIPCAVNGSDVVGVANTGTGKTAAFLLPLINKIILNPKEQVLIITPTRELALQIDQEFRLFTKGIRMISVCCVGGMNIGRQISNLRYGYNVIVGTPGRLKDLIDRKIINLSRFNSIVLDEADRMLDMGFINDTRFIMNGMPKEKQVLFFSATVSYDIEKLIREFLRNPVRVSVKTRDTAKNIEQNVVRIERGKNKLDVLNELLRRVEFNKVLIFGRTKHGVEKLSKNLSHNGFKAESIHGNKNNSQRQRALNLFKNNRVQVLVATDVAARGLDVANISHVINYDIPATYTDYVHRIGRTGRVDKKGMALTFIES
ncbi:DEAD/DEAH box helicase [Patescibacteria group bacterium]|nr:DEAD/DEAH box helicase [Patescibacteria group bacterium]